MLGRAAIAVRLPHAGRMCLLDRVVHWDEHSIRCSAITHSDPDNPLRELGGLAAFAGIEYAAQAAAIHSALTRGEPAMRSGVLGSLKNVTATRPWMHDVAGEVLVDVTLLHSDAAGGIFSFATQAGEERILSGQFTLMYVGATKELPA